jgi:nucleoside-diphosphate-sugar epimerase
MDTSRAHRQLRWRPRHSTAETLAAMVQAARQQGLV